MITIDGIGDFEADKYGTLVMRSSVNVPALGGECSFLLEGYDGDPEPTDFHLAMRQFVGMDKKVLTDASEHLYSYYSDVKKSGWGEPPEIESTDQIWDHVDIGTEAVVSRRGNGDDRIYISLECGCAWEREHGLQIVFRDGKRITKVGAFDGHISNADAFDNPSLEDTVYVR